MENELDDPYLVLVGKKNKYVKNKNFEFVKVEVKMGDFGRKTAFIEKKTYEEFQSAKKELENCGIILNLDSAGRSLPAQAYARVEKGATEFKKTKSLKSAIEKIKSETAKVGYSEHHTGLALDLKIEYADTGYIIPDEIRKENPDAGEDLLRFLTRRTILEKHGFILRYADGLSDKTGFPTERWHWRYIGPKHSIRMAKLREITGKEIALEEYLDLLKVEQNFKTEDERLNTYAEILKNQNVELKI